MKAMDQEFGGQSPQMKKISTANQKVCLSRDEILALRFPRREQWTSLARSSVIALQLQSAQIIAKRTNEVIACRFCQQDRNWLQKESI